VHEHVDFHAVLTHRFHLNLTHPESECAAGFSDDVGLQDERYFGALVRMFDQALKAVSVLPDGHRPALLARLDAVRRMSHNFGYGVGDTVDELLAEHGADD